MSFFIFALLFLPFDLEILYCILPSSALMRKQVGSIEYVTVEAGSRRMASPSHALIEIDAPSLGTSNHVDGFTMVWTTNKNLSLLGKAKCQSSCPGRLKQSTTRFDV